MSKRGKWRAKRERRPASAPRISSSQMSWIVDYALLFPSGAEEEGDVTVEASDISGALLAAHPLVYDAMEEAGAVGWTIWSCCLCEGEALFPAMAAGEGK